MNDLRCLCCDRELSEDTLGSHHALVLTDERGQASEVLGAWCDEKCLGEWLVKSALEAMLKRMMQPSSN